MPHLLQSLCMQYLQPTCLLCCLSGCHTEIACACSDPVNIYLGVLAAVGSVSFVQDWHATLQTIGLWGLLLSTGNWARKTEDPGVRPALGTLRKLSTCLWIACHLCKTGMPHCNSSAQVPATGRARQRTQGCVPP